MKLYKIGGYNEVEKNMAALEVRDETVRLDIGYDMEEFIDMDNPAESLPTKEMIRSR